MTLHVPPLLKNFQQGDEADNAGKGVRPGRQDKQRDRQHDRVVSAIKPAGSTSRKHVLNTASLLRQRLPPFFHSRGNDGARGAEGEKSIPSPEWCCQDHHPLIFQQPSHS